MLQKNFMKNTDLVLVEDKAMNKDFGTAVAGFVENKVLHKDFGMVVVGFVVDSRL